MSFDQLLNPDSVVLTVLVVAGISSVIIGIVIACLWGWVWVDQKKAFEATTVDGIVLKLGPRRRDGSHSVESFRNGLPLDELSFRRCWIRTVIKGQKRVVEGKAVKGYELTINYRDTSHNLKAIHTKEVINIRS